MRYYTLENTRKEKIKGGYKIYLNNSVESFSCHFHEYYEIEFLISGSAKTIINGMEFDLKKGSAYILRPTDLHEFIRLPDTKMYSINVHGNFFDEKLYNEFINKNTFIVTNFNENELNYAVSLCESMQIFNNSSRKDIQAKNVIDLFLNLFLEKLSDVVYAKTPNPIYGAIKFINENFTKNPTLKDVADYIGLAETYFCRKFKLTTGKTYVEYLNKLKTDFAKRLLENSLLSVTEICFLSGFNSISQFIREFKKATFFTPKEYKTKIKNGEITM